MVTAVLLVVGMVVVAARCYRRYRCRIVITKASLRG